jgi:hypothetical protein
MQCLPAGIRIGEPHASEVVREDGGLGPGLEIAGGLNPIALAGAALDLKFPRAGQQLER